MNQRNIGVIFTNLAIPRGPHFVAVEHGPVEKVSLSIRSSVVFHGKLFLVYQRVEHFAVTVRSDIIMYTKPIIQL